MRKLLLSVLVLLLTAGVASALSFTNTVDFSGPNGASYRIIPDTGNTIPPGDPGYNFAFSYDHTVNFNPAAESITNATLTLRHKFNYGYDYGSFLGVDLGEVWFLWNDTAQLLGNLSASNNSWVNQDFILPSSLFAGVAGSTWTIGFRLDENTWGENETLWIDWSKLSGNYNPVPEPATMLLLGLGLVGLGAYGRKRV